MKVEYRNEQVKAAHHTHEHLRSGDVLPPRAPISVV